MKTIFYKESTDAENADYFFSDRPFNVWFSLDDVLYPGNAAAYMIQKGTQIRKTIFISEVADEFAHDSIIRRIACLTV